MGSVHASSSPQSAQRGVHLVWAVTKPWLRRRCDVVPLVDELVWMTDGGRRQWTQSMAAHGQVQMGP
jgi:hypothetical protein